MQMFSSLWLAIINTARAVKYFCWSYISAVKESMLKTHNFRVEVSGLILELVIFDVWVANWMSLLGYISVKHKFSDRSYWMRFSDFQCRADHITWCHISFNLIICDFELFLFRFTRCTTLLQFKSKTVRTFKIGPRQKKFRLQVSTWREEIEN